MTVGQAGKVVVGIINREQTKMAYRVEVSIEGIVDSEAGPITLEDGEEWKGTVSFTPNRAGNKQKVEFRLYRQGQEEVYQGLYLHIDVR